VKRVLLLMLFSACGAPSRPDAGVRDGGNLNLLRDCSPWAVSDGGLTLGTNVSQFTAAGDLVIFGTGDPALIIARRLSSGTERRLGFATPLWESLPSESRFFVLTYASSTSPLATFDLRAIDVEACTRSGPIAQSKHGPPELSEVITTPTFCDPGFVWVTQSVTANALSVSGLRAINAPDRGNLSPACADRVLSWWSTDSATGEPGFINWARTDLDASVQLVTEGRVAAVQGLAISSEWTAWIENNSDGGSSVHAFARDAGVPVIAARVPFTRYDALGLHGSVALWRERSGNTTRLVSMELRDGGHISRDVEVDAQHAIVEHGVVSLSAGTLTWDPSFAP
jgi:hypothetical protein